MRWASHAQPKHRSSAFGARRSHPPRATRHNLPALYVFTVQLGPEYKHIHTLISQYPFWVFSHVGPLLPPAWVGLRCIHHYDAPVPVAGSKLHRPIDSSIQAKLNVT